MSARPQHLPRRLSLARAALAGALASALAGAAGAADDAGQLQRVEALARQTRVSEERILDEIMGRLGRIESTTADIRTLIENMPVAGAPPAPAPAVAATPVAPTPAAPAPVCPKPPLVAAVEHDEDATALPLSLVAGASAALALLIGLLIGRRRKAPPPTSPGIAATSIGAHSKPPTMPPAASKKEIPLWQPQTSSAALNAAPTPAQTSKAAAAATAPVVDAHGAAAAPAAMPAPVPASSVEVHVLPTEVDQVGGKEMFDPTLELAEIMMSMGMASGAAQALEEHIRENPREALVHWLKLLDIYRKDGHRTDFEKAARELRKNFNIQAADWLGGSAASATLEDFKRVMQQVITLWSQPGECVSYLSHLLEDNRDGMRNGFPQPVAEEILLLIAIQRTIHPDLLAAGPTAAPEPALEPAQ